MKHWTQAIGDLAPGDLNCARFDWSEYEIRSLTQNDQELFDRVYSLMWEEFGEKGELERPQVLYERLAWDPLQIRNGRSLAYEILVILKNHEIIAFRDHSIITTPQASILTSVIHLSHAWIKLEYRRLGISGWLRSWPIQKARECLKKHELLSDSLIILAAEMEHFDPHIPEKILRLRSYAKAQFKTLDPSFFKYAQPDFRSAQVIDQTGGPHPVPLALLVRKLGKENEDHISVKEAKQVIESIYHMYSQSIREQDMLPLWNLYHQATTQIDEHRTLKLLSPLPCDSPPQSNRQPEALPKQTDTLIIESPEFTPPQHPLPQLHPDTPKIRREGSH